MFFIVPKNIERLKSVWNEVLGRYVVKKKKNDGSI